MSRSTLAVMLSQLRTFSTPDMLLEQYPTPSEVAATILWNNQEVIRGKHVLDLGCGTGILGIGALILGAKKVTFADIDSQALSVLKENLESISHQGIVRILEIDVKIAGLLQAEVTDSVDVILTNPPFGTKELSADKEFLNAAATISAPYIFVFHRASTEEFILAHAKLLSYTLEERQLFEFNLPVTMAQHVQTKHPVAVVCYQLAKKATQGL